ncbi:MAG: AEC family transporter [Planctomycetota bacterium]
MIEAFTTAFTGIFTAVIQVFLIALGACLLVRKNIITSENITSLSAVTINVLLPCLIFSQITRSFDPAALRIWPVLPLAAVIMVFVGLAFAAMLFLRELHAKKDMLALASIQNAAYFVLPLGKVLYPDRFDEFALYCFLFVLGISPVLWTVGKYLATSSGYGRPTVKELITPPFAANVLAIVCVFTRTNKLIPGVLSDSMYLLGSATVPIALFIMGAILGGVKFRLTGYWLDAIKAISTKLIFIPAVTVTVLYCVELKKSFPIMADLLVIQAAAAPAAALLIQIRHYGGNEQKAGSIILADYVLCLFTVPFWLALFRSLG